jgi:hypothetical protein
MTTNLLPLYVACFAIIGLLGGFALHNRRTGWVKRRKSLFDDLLELQAFAKDLEGSVSSEPGPVGIGKVPSLNDAVPFSLQLDGLNAGLRTGMNASGPEVRVEQKDQVSA